MVNYQQRRYWTGILLVFAVMISIATLLYTNYLIREVKKEEFKIISIFAQSIEQINNSLFSEDPQDISFYFQIIEKNETIPVILADSNDKILQFRNIDSNKINKPGYLQNQLKIMKLQHKPIIINYLADKYQYVYYKNSKLITHLTIYPWVQFFLVLIFIVIAYFAFNSSRKFEQNKVWIGMSKETAHQLGTPVSSLLALAETIKEADKVIDKETIDELEKDIQRLETITGRFSKIGSIPKPEHQNIYQTIEKTLSYLKPRVSKHIKISLDENSSATAEAFIIPLLFDWVIENLVKNAINAMEGSGEISILVSESDRHVFVDVSDKGKGIPRSKYSTIFKAGFTTSKGGWGLGLSLSKRIINNYHQGEIFVKSSELGKGSTFRIKLRK